MTVRGMLGGGCIEGVLVEPMIPGLALRGQRFGVQGLRFRVKVQSSQIPRIQCFQNHVHFFGSPIIIMTVCRALVLEPTTVLALNSKKMDVLTIPTYWFLVGTQGMSSLCTILPDSLLRTDKNMEIWEV